jgi:hypothetical protein
MSRGALLAASVDGDRSHLRRRDVDSDDELH